LLEPDAPVSSLRLLARNPSRIHSPKNIAANTPRKIPSSDSYALARLMVDGFPFRGVSAAPQSGASY